MITIKRIKFSDIVFEERVKLGCFYCKNYNKKLTCPPNIPDLDYNKILSECDNLHIICHKHHFQNIITHKDRADSTHAIHDFILSTEKKLGLNNNPIILSFIGGCCKLCGYECGLICDTEHRRISLEAIGVNVVKSMHNVGVDLIFPPKEYFYRIGLIAC